MSWAPGSGVPLTRRLIAQLAARFTLTLVGVGMTVVLMLFLLALNDGVRTEANGWVASRPVDAWVGQKNTTNFIKASSFVMTRIADSLAGPDVEEVTPLLRLITLLDVKDRRVTAIVVGLDPSSPAGAPQVVEGSATLDSAGIIIDRALARRLGVTVGDALSIEDRHFRVSGISRGTNSILTQFAFITLDDARALLGFPGVASYLLVRGREGVPRDTLLAHLRSRAPRQEVVAQDAFAANNMDELRGGLIPVLVSVAVLGGIVAVVVLTLLLYGAVLERREDYALLKAIGAPSGVLGRVMLGQAVAAVAGGLVVGLLAYAVAVPVVGALAPAVPLALSVRTVTMVAVAAIVIGAAGTLLPLRRIARIHPAEVFRA